MILLVRALQLKGISAENIKLLETGIKGFEDLERLAAAPDKIQIRKDVSLGPKPTVLRLGVATTKIEAFTKKLVELDSTPNLINTSSAKLPTVSADERFSADPLRRDRAVAVEDEYERQLSALIKESEAFRQHLLGVSKQAESKFKIASVVQTYLEDHMEDITSASAVFGLGEANALSAFGLADDLGNFRGALKDLLNEINKFILPKLNHEIGERQRDLRNMHTNRQVFHI